MTTEERNGLGSALRTADDVAAASELADTVVNDADTTGNTAASMQPVKESEYDVMGATDVDASDRIGIKDDNVSIPLKVIRADTTSSTRGSYHANGAEATAEQDSTSVQELIAQVSGESIIETTKPAEEERTADSTADDQLPATQQPALADTAKTFTDLPTTNSSDNREIQSVSNDVVSADKLGMTTSFPISDDLSSSDSTDEVVPTKGEGETYAIESSSIAEIGHAALAEATEDAPGGVETVLCTEASIEDKATPLVKDIPQDNDMTSIAIEDQGSATGGTASIEQMEPQYTSAHTLNTSSSALPTSDTAPETEKIVVTDRNAPHGSVTHIAERQQDDGQRSAVGGDDTPPATESALVSAVEEVESEVGVSDQKEIPPVQVETVQANTNPVEPGEAHLSTEAVAASDVAPIAAVEGGEVATNTRLEDIAHADIAVAPEPNNIGEAGTQPEETQDEAILPKAIADLEHQELVVEGLEQSLTVPEDEAGAMAQSSERDEQVATLAERPVGSDQEKTVWTPSYSVTTQGPHVSEDADQGVANPELQIPYFTASEEIQEKNAPIEASVTEIVPVISTTEHFEGAAEDNERHTALTVHTDAERSPIDVPRPKSPWTPSYSVSVQGSPRVETIEMPQSGQTAPAMQQDDTGTTLHTGVSEDQLDRQTEAERHGSHEGGAVSPVVQLDQIGVVLDNYDSNLVSTEVAGVGVDVAEAHEPHPKSPWTPSYSVSVQGSPRKAAMDVPQFEQAAPVDNGQDAGIVTDVALQAASDDRIDQEAPSDEYETQSNSAENPEIQLEKTDVRPGDARDRPPSKVPTLEIDAPDALAKQTLEPHPKSPWTPSYSVSVQGSHAVEAIERAQFGQAALTQQDDLSGPGAAVSNGYIEHQAETGDLKTHGTSVAADPDIRVGQADAGPEIEFSDLGTIKPVIGIGIDVTGPSSSVAEQALEPRPKSPWTPSYSVSVLGSAPADIDDVAQAVPAHQENLSETAPGVSVSDERVEHHVETGAASPDIQVDEADTARETDFPDITKPIGIGIDTAELSLTEQTLEPRPKSPWTPSYSVSVLGSAPAEIDEVAQAVPAQQEDLSETIPEVSVSDKGVEQHAVHEDCNTHDTGGATPGIQLDETDVIPGNTSQDVDSARVAGVSEQTLEPRPKSPWTPSYSVSVQGSPRVETVEVAQSNYTLIAQDDTPTAQEKNLDETAYNSMSPSEPLSEEARESRHDTLWTPSYSVDVQGTPVVDPPASFPPGHVSESLPETSFDPTEVIVSEPFAVSPDTGLAGSDDTLQEPGLRSDVSASSISEAADGRQGSPWTPSYSVSAQGLAHTELAELIPPNETSANANAPLLHVAEQTDAAILVLPDRPLTVSEDVLSKDTEPTEEPAATAASDVSPVDFSPSTHSQSIQTSPAHTAHVVEENLMPRSSSPWTPSYSVNVQGSPRPDIIELEDAQLDQPTGKITTSHAEDVSQPPPESAAANQDAPARIESSSESGLITDPEPCAAPVTGLNQGPSANVNGDTTSLRQHDDSLQPPPKAHWTPSYSVSVQGSPRLLDVEIPQVDEPLSLEEEDTNNVLGGVSGTVETSAKEESTLPDEDDALVAEGKTVPHEGNTVPEESITTPQIALTEAKDVSRSGEDALQASLREETLEPRPKSPWSASYSVTVQGSPRLGGSELDESCHAPPTAVAPGAPNSPAPDLPATFASDAANEGIIAEERQLDHVPESSIVDVAPDEREGRELLGLGALTSTLLEQPAKPLLPPAAAPAATVEERPKSPYRPPYSVTRQGSGLLDTSEVVHSDQAGPPESSAHIAEPPDQTAVADVEAEPDKTFASLTNLDVQIPVTVMQVFPNKEDKSSPKLMRRPTLPRLAPVDEMTSTEGTDGTTLLDTTSPATTRTRLESTTSSRFFPGGWFSSSPKLPQGRASLDVASGEFVPIQPSDSPLNTLSAPTPAPTPTTRKEKKSKMCIIM